MAIAKKEIRLQAQNKASNAVPEETSEDKLSGDNGRPSGRTSKLRSIIFNNILWFFLILGVLATGYYSYLLFHSLVELFSIVVACTIFMIAWHSRRFMDNNYLLFLGIASLFIGFIEAFHMLSYRGMGIFTEYGTNLPTQLWIASRYFQSASLLLAPFFLNRKLKPRLVFSAYLLATTLLFISIFLLRIFPTCYIEGQGLTAFKIVSEYVIIFILLLSTGAVVRHREKFDRRVLYFLIASIAAMVTSEFAFTLYLDPYALPNLIGHILMIFSFYFLYRALIDTGLSKPYHLLFRNLKQNEEALRESEAKYRVLSEHLEEKVKEKVAELKLAQRLAALGQMVSVVAHEVRNPLQNISMGIEAIKNELGDTKEISDILEEIDNGIESLSSVVTELLDYSRPAAVHAKPWPVGVLVNRAVSALTKRMQNIHIHMELEDDTMEIHVDDLKFIRVLVNLLSNSAEAMAERGSIWIKSNSCLRDSRQCLCLSITDSGPGIPQENLEEIFEPFFTTKTRGTGLGLPISKKIIEAHGGSLGFRSTSNDGATAEIILPVN